jgi:hypothetical protein
MESLAMMMAPRMAVATWEEWLNSVLDDKSHLCDN